MAKIVVFEGADRTGKETQSKLLQHALMRYGFKTKLVEVPAKDCTKTYNLIYKMLHDGTAKKYPNVFQFVQFMNKWLYQQFVLPKILKENDVLILDRWALSAVIYGNATGVNNRFNTWLFNRLKKPDITFVIYGTSFKRSTTVDDSYEKDTDLQERVKDDYMMWAVEHADDHILVKNDKSAEAMHRSIMIDMAVCEII